MKELPMVALSDAFRQCVDYKLAMHRQGPARVLHHKLHSLSLTQMMTKLFPLCLRDRYFRQVIWVGGLLPIAIACSDVTHVSEPGLVTTSGIQNATGANLLRNQAFADFRSGYGQQVLASGVISDEFGATPQAQFLLSADSRHVTAQVQLYPYATLSRARVEALEAIDALEQFSSDSSMQIAELFSFLGFTETFFSEDMCSGVPTAVVSNGAASYGSNLTRVQLLALALSHFDSALSHTVTDDSISQLATIGKGRALLDSGAFASAANVMATVPTGYVFNLAFDTSSLAQNPVAFPPNQIPEYTVSDREGGNGIDFVSAGDPRSATYAAAPNVWGILADSSVSAPLSLATGVEARLTIAEAALRSGDVSFWAEILNQLRQSAIVPSISNLTADSTTNASSVLQMEVMFRERALWLFATGHRQGDLRRLVHQYAQSVNSVFPTGLYQGGPQTYGNDVTFVPYGESFNPSYSNCINRTP